ncbi:MAG: asparagine synthase (glutamine-hydrolyzing) [Flavobacteriales bacterium]|nr:asparagine synthase (glutamine-hydrolyzing) [Flavobacteriales bacterium]
MTLKEGARQEPDAIVRMTESISHRGPDHQGFFVEDGLQLGHRRLSILDLSAAGNQPMESACGRYVIIHNGEIYNFREVRQQLTDHDFTTHTDTEVILAAYAKWGRACLEKFNGMFAFAIWDKQERVLFIARDRLGIKPLYYHADGNRLVFASEVRSLLASGQVPRKLSMASLAEYLRYQTVHAPSTLLQDVHMLMPGHCLMADRNGVRTEAWWTLTYRPVSDSPEQVRKRVKELFYRAVERRLVSDVPFGAFLSGGIDSSAVVGAMSEVSTQPVSTFSVVFREEAYSEREFAAMVAKRFHAKHHEILLEAKDFLHALPDALGAMDHPSGDGPNTYVVSKVTRAAGITMALSGLGGDELFAGYPIFKRMHRLHQYRWLFGLPAPLKRMLMLAGGKGIQQQKIRQILQLPAYDFDAIYALNRQVLLDRQIASLLASEHPQNRLVRQEDSVPVLSQVSRAEITTYMQNVLLRDADQMSMAHALEVRVPFLDHELVEYVYSLGDDMKYPATPKKLLTDSLAGLLPDEIVNRPKMGFVLPWEVWMRNELKDFCRERIGLLQENTCWRPDALTGLWDDFLQGNPSVTWSRIWPLVALSDWIQKLDIDV